MKNKFALTIMALGLVLPAVTLNAQDDARPPRGPRGDGPRPSPLIASLDVNHDGTIDQSELSAASESLKALDKNKDGKLTAEELRPGRGPGPKGGGERPEPAGADNDGPKPGAGRPGGPPIVAALDTNADGVIDATEIANATTALKALDKNGDGQLTKDEVGRPGPRGNGPEGKKRRSQDGQ